MQAIDPPIHEPYEVNDKFLQLFLLLVNNTCPIKRIQILWADDGPAATLGLGGKLLSTGQALTGPCAHLLADNSLSESEFCGIVNDHGRHEAESCSLSDKAAEMRVRLTRKAEVYRCHAGLIDIAVPVVCDGQYVATLFTGQVLDEAPAPCNFVQIRESASALTYIDWKELEKAYHRVPVVSDSDIRRTVEVLELLAGHLANTLKQLSGASCDEQRKHREADLERKEFTQLVLNANVAYWPVVRRLMDHIGLSREPDCVIVVQPEHDAYDEKDLTVVELKNALVFDAVEKFCYGMKDVCCSYLRSRGICIFFRNEQDSGRSAMPYAARSFANKLLESLSTYYDLKVRIGIGSPKSNWSDLADSYHEAYGALASSTSAVAIYEPLTFPDEELSSIVCRICANITEKKILNARMLVFELPVLVHKALGNNPENLRAQHHFFAYALDAMAITARQLCGGAFDAGSLPAAGKRTMENARSAFSLRESFLRSAESILDTLRGSLLSRPMRLLNRACTVVENALQERSSAQSLSVLKIATSLGISSGHLSRIFKRSAGVTLERYLMVKRIERARCLLLDPLKNVADVAESCGFSDPAYFARVFRDVAGCSPRQYRDNPMAALAPAKPFPGIPVASRRNGTESTVEVQCNVPTEREWEQTAACF